MAYSMSGPAICRAFLLGRCTMKFTRSFLKPVPVNITPLRFLFREPECVPKFRGIRGKRPLAVSLLAGALLLAPTSAHAVKRMDKAIYGYSTAPYWSVGDYSKKLSRACQRREFGQKRLMRYVIAFVGARGRAITGIAAKNWNLYDPSGLAVGGQTYHFFNDGYSDCSVYVAQQPRN